MKRKAFIGIRIVCFLTLCFCIMYYLSNVLTTTRVEEYPTRNGFWQNISAEDDNTIDLMFVGDSSVMHAINPMQIWKDVNVTSYVMSYSVMKPQEAYFDLKRLFKMQSPKYVFIESQFLVGMRKDNFDYYTGEIENLVDYCDYEISGEIDYFLPVMKYKSAWKTRHLSDFIHPHQNSINSVYKGYKYAPEVQPFTGVHTPIAEGIVEYKYSGNLYFDKIYNLCKNNNCQVILMTMPQGRAWNQKSHDKIVDLARQYNIEYYDFDINLDKWIPDFSWETDTKDAGGHLNYSGAMKLTNTFEEYLINKYDISVTDLTKKQKEKWDSDTREFYKIVNK